MTFFSQIYEKLAEGVPLKLTLLKNGNRLVVGVIPDIEDESLVPATMSGAPDEIDQAFFAALGGNITLTGIHLNDKMIKEAAKKKDDSKPAATETKPEEKKPDLFNTDKPKEEPVKADQPKSTAPAPGSPKPVAPGPGVSKPMNVGKDITKETEPEPEPVEDSGDASWDDPEESSDPEESPSTEKPKTDVEPNQSEPSAIIDEDEDWEV